MGCQQLGGKVISGVIPLSCGELTAITPVGQHLFGNDHLLVLVWIAPRKGLAVAAPILQQFVVRLGETDEAKDGLAGQRESEGVYELSRVRAGQHLVDQLMAAPGDIGLERTQPSPRETGPGMNPDAAVVWLRPVGHHGNGVEVRSGQDLGRSGTDGKDRVLHISGGVHIGIHEDLFDVFHPGDNHIAQLLGEENRRVVS